MAVPCRASCSSVTAGSVNIEHVVIKHLRYLHSITITSTAALSTSTSETQTELRQGQNCQPFPHQFGLRLIRWQRFVVHIRRETGACL